MRNSVAFKFVAVLLCAVSLLGMVASAVGIFALSQGDLYNKTVDQMIEERIQTEGGSAARQIALRYASVELGGCPERLADRKFPNYGGFFAGFGYELVDSEGMVLDSESVPDPAAVHSLYSFPVTGQYMHLISLQTQEEAYAAETVDPASYSSETMDGERYLHSMVPPEGAVVTGVMLECSDGSRHDAMLGYPIGMLYYAQDGRIVCQFLNFVLEKPEHIDVTYIRIHGEDEILLYEAASPEGVGRFTYNAYGDTMMFLSTVFADDVAAETAVEETVIPETVPESVPATVPETIPPETWIEEEPATEYTETVETTMAVTQPEETVPSSASAYPEETTVPSTEPVWTVNGKPLSEYEISSAEYYDSSTQQDMHAEYVYLPMPEYTVKLYLTGDSLLYQDSYAVLRIVQQYRQLLLPILGVCAFVFVILAVYLCCAAGRSPKTEEVRAGGLNRIPLDLYFGFDCFAVTGLVVAAVEGGDYLLRQNLTLGVACAAGCGLGASLLTVGFLFACVAQGKTPGGFWYRNTLCGHSIRWFMNFVHWLEGIMVEKGFPFCGRLLKFCGHLIKKFWKHTVTLTIWGYRTTEKALLWAGNRMGRIFRWMIGKLHRFLVMLPVTWQWLILGSAMILLLFITVAGRYDFGMVVSIFFAFGLILYSAHCFGILWESTKKMSKGDLDSKVDDKLMLGAFKEFAADLNALAGVAVVAAQKQLKSERMKTELITNVSHDIKTPLTSIINYVDLLQKPHTEAEAEQYLEVLDRQSQRLKKLIEDLMDMSKASTGNMAVEITQVDAVESINQALGEFADKLDRAQLTPVFRHTEATVPMMADGRLVWRVMSNLLSNAVKYAMPGTRLYVDLSQLEDKVVISLKNISREELNVAADELMERFVRGDDSRNTEGSGLGLNIAKSLMELQKGQLQLLVDGDLFKVTLIFPAE